jgi:hypothetical protein
VPAVDGMRVAPARTGRPRTAGRGQTAGHGPALTAGSHDGRPLDRPPTDESVPTGGAGRARRRRLGTGRHGPSGWPQRLAARRSPDRLARSGSTGGQPRTGRGGWPARRARTDGRPWTGAGGPGPAHTPARRGTERTSRPDDGPRRCPPGLAGADRPARRAGGAGVGGWARIGSRAESARRRVACVPPPGHRRSRA